MGATSTLIVVALGVERDAAVTSVEVLITAINVIDVDAKSL